MVTKRASILMVSALWLVLHGESDALPALPHPPLHTLCLLLDCKVKGRSQFPIPCLGCRRCSMKNAIVPLKWSSNLAKLIYEVKGQHNGSILGGNGNWKGVSMLYVLICILFPRVFTQNSLVCIIMYLCIFSVCYVFIIFLMNQSISQWWNSTKLKLEMLPSYRMGTASWGRGWQIFSVSGQILNVLALACHTVSVSAPQLCCCSTNVAIDNRETRWVWLCSSKT